MGVAGIEAIQAQPGEVSLAIDRLKGGRHFAAEFKTRFSAINGIEQVEPDADRGPLCGRIAGKMQAKNQKKRRNSLELRLN